MQSWELDCNMRKQSTHKRKQSTHHGNQQCQKRQQESHFLRNPWFCLVLTLSGPQMEGVCHWGAGGDNLSEDVPLLEFT